MSHYWTCSKIADIVRGTPMPSGGTSEEWDVWHTTAKAKSPLRYWLADEGIRAVETIVWSPIDLYDSIRYYINNRWISNSHALTAHPRDIARGQWRDLGDRFLPCMFNELVDFVEIEQAWSHIQWSSGGLVKYNAPTGILGMWRRRSWRCKQAGLDYLTWASSLVFDADSYGIDTTDKRYGTPTPQAVTAKEIAALYTWWTVTRPLRSDPYETSGWTAYCASKREGGSAMSLFSAKTPAEEAESKRAHAKLDKIEKQYDMEDEKMLIRLIKIRDSLWT